MVRQKVQIFAFYCLKNFFNLVQLPVRSGRLGIGENSNFLLGGPICLIPRTYGLSAMANFLKIFLRGSLESGVSNRVWDRGNDFKGWGMQ
ncbi:unnamed protein product [Meloidogyne enterolobii]|uniref:Uncharacterized protein n=1 Tax=Meloidogyne enterolobii TaxID=390850 RepID=A0ACB0XQ58_MELEN